MTSVIINGGGYYLGEYPEFKFESATIELINHTIRSYGIKKCYFCGSSKGGWAALNIGLRFNESYGAGIIVGAPQFYLGKYLRGDANRVTLEGICGKEDSEKVIKVLDTYLKNTIVDNSKGKKQRIYIHYSTKEHTYEEHIVSLIDELKKFNYEIICEEKEYLNHNDVGIYFPQFLLKILTIIFKKQDQ